METVGIFDSLTSAGQAVEKLMAAGFPEGEITSLTSIPYPNDVIVHTDHRSYFRWITLACAVVGAGAGFLLAAGTAWLYPVQTGDKPIIALYPAGIITYELTMLFAMVGTMVGMFVEMRLPAWKGRPYDPAISEGYIGISVMTASAAEGSRAEEVMRQAGAVRITPEGTP